MQFFAAAIAAATVLACSDPTGSAPKDELSGIQVTANVTNTSINLLVIRVSAPDIPRPLVFNIPVVSGIASGTLRLPAGDDRLLEVQAFDVVGEITHDASVTIDVLRGPNPALHLSLVPRNGDLPVDIHMGPYSVVIDPASYAMSIGNTVQLAVSIHAPNGDAITSGALWATGDPSIATVSGTGLVTAHRAGNTTIVSTFGGVAGTMELSVSDATAPIVVVGPSYPPPGGVTFSGAGLTGVAPGRTNIYADLDLSATRFLAFGADASALPGLAFDGTIDPSERMTVDVANSNPAAGIIRWTGQTQIPVAGGSMPIPTRFTLTLTSGSSGTPIPLTPAAGGSVPASIGFVAEITTSEFRANLLFEALYAGSWGPANTVFDAIPLKDASAFSRSSFSGGFYYSF
jgi:hypothetical protein